MADKISPGWRQLEKETGNSPNPEFTERAEPSGVGEGCLGLLGLKTLFEIPKAHPMAFKAGTSLSKVYGVIERFSDITLDYKALLLFKEGISRSQLIKLTETLRGLVSEHTHEVIFPAFVVANQ